MKRKLYLAYGSNINQEQMKERCPSAKALGSGLLEGYRLEFHGVEGRCVATIRRDCIHAVPVFFWAITAEDEARLDVYEGYPKRYVKKTVTMDIKGKKVEGMVYIMTKNEPIGKPSDRYLSTIRRGYMAAQIPTSYLFNAYRFSTENKKGDYLWKTV